MQRKKAVVLCPQCGKEVAWGDESPYRPFCSERCKLIDLGQWANENYRIPLSEDQDAEPEEPSIPVSFRS